MSKIKIGIIGSTGRMGRLLSEELSLHEYFSEGIGFNSSKGRSASLEDVFANNDYIIDFSSASITLDVLKTARVAKKPLVICTTGWATESYRELLNEIAENVPIVITSNTSLGAYLHKYLVFKAAELLGTEYDIDLTEKHHRNKIDLPSGTAHALLDGIKEVKQNKFNLDYKYGSVEKGQREDNKINFNCYRSGNLIGDHKVEFTSSGEIISIRHIALDRRIFAKGAVRILGWIRDKSPSPGIYRIEDIYN